MIPTRGPPPPPLYSFCIYILFLWVFFLFLLVVPFVESCSGRFNVFRIAFIFASFRLPFKHHLRQIGVTFCRLFLLLFFLFFIYCMVCLRAFCAFQVGLVYFCPGERFVELIMFIFSLSLFLQVLCCCCCSFPFSRYSRVLFWYRFFTPTRSSSSLSSPTGPVLLDCDFVVVVVIALWTFFFWVGLGVDLRDVLQVQRRGWCKGLCTCVCMFACMSALSRNEFSSLFIEGVSVEAVCWTWFVYFHDNLERSFG